MWVPLCSIIACCFDCIDLHKPSVECLSTDSMHYLKSALLNGCSTFHFNTFHKWHVKPIESIYFECLSYWSSHLSYNNIFFLSICCSNYQYLWFHQWNKLTSAIGDHTTLHFENSTTIITLHIKTHFIVHLAMMVKKKMLCMPLNPKMNFDSTDHSKTFGILSLFSCVNFKWASLSWFQ